MYRQRLWDHKKQAENVIKRIISPFLMPKTRKNTSSYIFLFFDDMSHLFLYIHKLIFRQTVAKLPRQTVCLTFVEIYLQKYALFLKKEMN